MTERVQFVLEDATRYDRLARFVNALAAAKANGDFRDDEYWESFLDERARSCFRWPPYDDDPPQPGLLRRLFARPVAEPRWIFGSIVAAVEDGEYELAGCARGPDGSGAIEFDPHAWPYGGTDWMRAAIEAFGGRVTRDASI